MKKILFVLFLLVFTSVLYAKEDILFYSDSLDNVYKRITENISQYYSFYPIDTLKNSSIVMDWNKIYDINNDNPQREKFKIKLSEENNLTRVDIDYKYECYSRKGWNEPSQENMKLCFDNFISVIESKNVNKIKLREYKNFDAKTNEVKNIKNNQNVKENSNVLKPTLTEVQKAQLKKYSGISYDKLYSTMLKNLKSEYKNIKIADKTKGSIETMWVYPKGKNKLTATKRIKVFVKFKTKTKTTTVLTIKVEKNNKSVWEKVTLSDKQQISMYTNLYKKLETNLK